MTARPWGGHTNGRIPLRELVFVGNGALSGEPQYLHPACAAAWRRFVADVRAEFGVGIVITEGFRPLALQQHYWNTLPRPKAAWPGTSTHGWALAVDMANYHRAPKDDLRELGERNGFSFETGDEYSEPWHLEYVGSLLAPAGGSTTPIIADPEPTPEETLAMSSMTIHHQVNTNGSQAFLAEGAFGFQIVSRAWALAILKPQGKDLPTEDERINEFDYNALAEAKKADVAMGVAAIAAALGAQSAGGNEAAVAAAVEARLADDFARVQAQIAAQPTEFRITPA